MKHLPAPGWEPWAPSTSSTGVCKCLSAHPFVRMFRKGEQLRCEKCVPKAATLDDAPTSEETTALRIVAEKARAIRLVFEGGRPLVNGAFELERALYHLDKVASQTITAGPDEASEHVQLQRISGALCDAGDITLYEGDYARSIRELIAQRDELRLKLKSLEKPDE